MEVELRKGKIMDELNTGFGQLSTKAAEWKPGGTSNNSELTSSSVKEFVPGKGWTNETDYDAEEKQGIRQLCAIVETTVPTGPPASHAPSFRGLHATGLSDDLWRFYRDQSLEATRQLDPADPLNKAVPLPYCNAFCLDSRQRGRSSLGYPSSTFQVANREDGNLYCLKRFDNVRSVSPKIALSVTDRWTGSAAVQDHPGVVPFHRCFVSQRAVFFVHGYIPGARTLKERLGGALSESILWSCITQLVSILRTVHKSNLAVRTLKLQHVLSTSDSTGSRLRLRVVGGIVDALEFESRKHVGDLQIEDIRDFGRLILSLATGTEVTANMELGDLNNCESFIVQNYSRDLHNLAMTLIRSARPPSILDVSKAIAARCFDEHDEVYRTLDLSERNLSAEYDSSRAYRLLLKLGFINERPEFGPNRRWAQSGDCYILTLFRDYVFHQADGAGYPVMDLGHVVTALNKLDAADEEKIVLTSRDSKSLMVVSYADVARCLENAFHELCGGAVPPSALQF